MPRSGKNKKFSRSVKSPGILFEKMVQEHTKEGDALATEAGTKKNKTDLLAKLHAMPSKSREKRKESENTLRKWTWIF